MTLSQHPLSGHSTLREGISRTILMLTLIVGLLTGTLPASAQSPASPSALAASELLAIKPHLRDDVAAAMPAGLPVYDLALAFPASDDPGRSLRGTSTLTYTNTTGEALSALPFRLYANGADPEHDAVTIEEVTIAGAPIEPEWSVGNSVATVPLPATLAPGEEITISMQFTTHVPLDSNEHYGILNYSSETGTWALAQWYPVLAGRDPAFGWMLDPVSRNGDPIFTETGVYQLTVTAPANLQLITSGVAVSSEPDGDMRVSTFAAAPSRDVTIVADMDAQSVMHEVAGTTITSWFEPGRDEAGTAVADWAAQSVEMFNELLGEYPYLELHLAQVEIFGAAGVEFPQMIYLDSNYYAREVNHTAPSSFEFTVAHEVVHQWFYNLVGNNQYAHAFIDEGLTNYLSAQVYFERAYGEDAAAKVRRSYLEAPFESAVHGATDQIVDRPTDAFVSSRNYVMAVYSKAPLGFGAIHDQIGDDAFFGALQAYVREFRFRIATPPDLLAAFDDASDQDVQSVWTRWFERQEGNLDVPPR